MKIAVLTCTRDRLAYTQHCFQALHRNAGCEYDHYVLDNGSTDGTVEWLRHEVNELRLYLVAESKENLGVGQGISRLLSQALALDSYDAIVKIDNDCELSTPGTLDICAKYAVGHNAIVSPMILGLRNPPQISYLEGVFGYTGQIGGIFLAAPASFYEDWGPMTHLPKWGGDDILTCQVARDRGMPVGYLTNYAAWHYRSTDGQHEDYPYYFKRRVEEGGPS